MLWANKNIEATYRLSSLPLAVEYLTSLNGPHPERKSTVENKV